MSISKYYFKRFPLLSYCLIFCFYPEDLHNFRKRPVVAAWRQYKHVDQAAKIFRCQTQKSTYMFANGSTEIVKYTHTNMYVCVRARRPLRWVHFKKQINALKCFTHTTPMRVVYVRDCRQENLASEGFYSHFTVSVTSLGKRLTLTILILMQQIKCNTLGSWYT